MKTAIVTGGSSGLGKAILLAIQPNYPTVIDWSLSTGVDVRSVDSLSYAIVGLPVKIDVLINCAGVNRIDYLAQLQEGTWDEVMDTNAKGIFLTTQACLERLRGGTVLNIVSNAAHLPMTSSLAYNASKGAALIMTKQLARELKKTHDITVFSISPNKLNATMMSLYIDHKVCELRGWTSDQTRNYQLAGLPAGEETDVDTLAEFVGFLLSTKQRHKYLAGCDITYGGP